MAGQNPITGSISFTAGHSVTGRQIADLSLKYVGSPYRHGGNDLYTGVDSAGFVSAIYKLAGYTLPTSVNELAKEGSAVKSGGITAGDIFIYGDLDDSYTITPTHAAIYIGDGRVIHASNAREGIKISDSDYRKLCFIIRIIQ